MNNESSIIAGFSFGDGNIDHGKSNTALAEAIVAYAKSFPGFIPIFVQWELDHNLRKRGRIPLGIANKNSNGSYLTSRDVMVKLKKFMDDYHYDSIVLACHPAHVLRLRLMAKKLGIRITDTFSYDIPYDSESYQVWTRSALAWWLREIVTLAHHKYKGWI
jgi:hypothetical protein